MQVPGVVDNRAQRRNCSGAILSIVRGWCVHKCHEHRGAFSAPELRSADELCDQVVPASAGACDTTQQRGFSWGCVLSRAATSLLNYQSPPESRCRRLFLALRMGSDSPHTHGCDHPCSLAGREKMPRRSSRLPISDDLGRTAGMNKDTEAKQSPVQRNTPCTRQQNGVIGQRNVPRLARLLSRLRTGASAMCSLAVAPHLSVMGFARCFLASLHRLRNVQGGSTSYQGVGNGVIQHSPTCRCLLRRPLAGDSSRGPVHLAGALCKTGRRAAPPPPPPSNDTCSALPGDGATLRLRHQHLNYRRQEIDANLLGVSKRPACNGLWKLARLLIADRDNWSSGNKGGRGGGKSVAERTLIKYRALLVAAVTFPTRRQMRPLGSRTKAGLENGRRTSPVCLQGLSAWSARSAGTAGSCGHQSVLAWYLPEGLSKGLNVMEGGRGLVSVMSLFARTQPMGDFVRVASTREYFININDQLAQDCLNDDSTRPYRCVVYFRLVHRRLMNSSACARTCQTRQEIAGEKGHCRQGVASVVSGVVCTNRTMVSSNTYINKTGVLAVLDIGDSLLNAYVHECIPIGYLGLYTPGDVVAERLACLPPTKANRIQSPVGSLPDFHNLLEPPWTPLSQQQTCLVNPITARCGATVNEHTAEAPVCRGLRSLAYSSGVPNDRWEGVTLLAVQRVEFSAFEKRLVCNGCVAGVPWMPPEEGPRNQQTHHHRHQLLRRTRPRAKNAGEKFPDTVISLAEVSGSSGNSFPGTYDGIKPRDRSGERSTRSIWLFPAAPEWIVEWALVEVVFAWRAEERLLLDELHDEALCRRGSTALPTYKSLDGKKLTRILDVHSNHYRAGATVAERLDCSPPTMANRVQSPAGSLRIFACENRAGRYRNYFLSAVINLTGHMTVSRGHSSLAISTLASHQGEPGSNPGRVTGFSQAGIVPDDAVGQPLLSRISRFLRPFIPAPLYIHFNHPHRL
ncbi:hypothetical protein PR048_010470 [Dryococelus australis]|uniref:Uncharacterized protein n=1 Tax=Dryococelus australis TaxID=614101 RepID=A0ABQ9I3N7_9NEOP|nr:hypothetical protein PR048_010470 [Dryococelus australis]